MKYDTIVTHRNFHHDEAWAIFLLKKYGEEKYPGISQAKVRLVGNPQGVNALELIARGEICVGVGGGKYDEHGMSEATCAAEMVANDLGLKNNRAVGRIIEYVRRCDRDAGVRPQELPSLIKQWHRRHPGDPELVLERTLPILEDWLESNLEFQKSFETITIQRQRFPLTNSTAKATYAVLETDDPNAAAVARIKGAHVVVVKNSRGQVQIFTSSAKADHRSTPLIDLRIVAQKIRSAELTARGNTTGLPGLYLRNSGKLPEVPQWYYLASDTGQMLLNGSDQAAQEVEPTKVSLDQIVQAVISGARPGKAWTEGLQEGAK